LPGEPELAAKPLGITRRISRGVCVHEGRSNEDGRYEIEERTQARDYISFAPMDVFVAISNCPQDKNPATASIDALKVVLTRRAKPYLLSSR
jgi:hypothetical protein